MPAQAAFPIHIVADSMSARTMVAQHIATDSVLPTHRSLLTKRIDKIMSANQSDNNDEQKEVHPAHAKRSGIFGRLSLYLGLLSVAAFILAMCTLFSPFLVTAVVIWLYSDLFAVIFGSIGLVRRKKKGMAIAGIVLGVSMIALFFAIMAFLSAVASALPAIMATIIILGHA